MEELRRLLEELLDARLLGIVLSAPRQKESYRRIRIRALGLSRCAAVSGRILGWKERVS